MGKSAAPYGESDTRRSVHKKLLEFPTGSPSHFFAHISPRLALSNIKGVPGYGDGILLHRGYAPKATTKLVGDRYQLTARERLALTHAAWCGDVCRRRPLTPGQMRGKQLYIDGFNLLILLETALSGSVFIWGKDGLLRDVADIHSTYRIRTQTRRAIELVAEAIGELGIVWGRWLFDRPVYNSGRVAALVNAITGEREALMGAETAVVVDGLLKRCPNPIFSADSPVLDSGVAWFDLEGYIVSRKIPRARIVTLG